MKNVSRAAVLAAFGVGPLLLATGCGGDTATGASATLVNIQPTTYTEIPPVTTTTTTTIAFVESEAGTRSPNEQAYTIRAGDSLGAIASLHDITLDQLVSYNEFPNGANQLILPGDVIKIPPGALVPGTASSESTGSGTGTDTGTDTGTADPGTEVTNPGAGCTHTIAAGENPSKVAGQYDITVDELFAANPGGVMDTFLIGATLQIPPSGSC